MKILMNWIKKVGNIIVIEIKLIHAFVWRKVRRRMWSKNKASSSILAFPLCLKTTVKQDSFQKKVDMRFKKPGINRSC